MSNDYLIFYGNCESCRIFVLNNIIDGCNFITGTCITNKCCTSTQLTINLIKSKKTTITCLNY